MSAMASEPTASRELTSSGRTKPLRVSVCLFLSTSMSFVPLTCSRPSGVTASARMFDLNDFTELPDKHVDLGVQFAKPKYINWNQFRETEESRYVGLVAPRFLVREPYSEGNCKASFAFREEVDGRDHSKYLWANAAYAFGARLTDAFFNYGWTTAIIGEEIGGRVENQPPHTRRHHPQEFAR